MLGAATCPTFALPGLSLFSVLSTLAAYLSCVHHYLSHLWLFCSYFLHLVLVTWFQSIGLANKCHSDFSIRCNGKTQTNILVKYLWCFWPNLFFLLRKVKALWSWHRNFPLALDVKALHSDPWRCLVCRGSQGGRPGQVEPGLFSLFATFDSHIGYSPLMTFDKSVWPSSFMIFHVVVLISAHSFGKTSRKERQWG